MSTGYDLIGKWAKVFTWFTSHPADEKRFNEALRDVYEALGPDVEIEKLRETVERLASTQHGTPTGQSRQDAIDRYMQKAQAVLDYLKDSGR